jgi:hypothetical protein
MLILLLSLRARYTQKRDHKMRSKDEFIAVKKVKDGERLKNNFPESIKNAITLTTITIRGAHRIVCTLLIHLTLELITLKWILDNRLKCCVTSCNQFSDSMNIDSTQSPF